MRAEHQSQAAAEGRRWAEEKADALEGIEARDWPDEWEREWADELRLSGPRIDMSDVSELIDIAQREASTRWTELVETRRSLEDSQLEGGEIEVQAIWLFEALRRHTPSGLSVWREGSRVYLQDMENESEVAVTSLGEASRVISDWQERHLGH